MPFVYLSGEAAPVGAAGNHDYEFVSGKSLTDAAQDSFVYASGSPVGSGWTTFEVDIPDTLTRQAGGSPRVEIDTLGLRL